MIWVECVHDWGPIYDSDIGEDRIEVICVKCGCPGELDNKTGEVYWPTT